MERTLHPDSALLLMLRPYFSRNQRLGLIQMLCGEEGAWYRQRLREILNAISGIPALYATDSQGDKTVAQLHYFMSNADFYFTELDRESVDLSGFGLTIITDAELGYITLQEVLANGAELDLHWTPQPLVKYGRNAMHAQPFNDEMWMAFAGSSEWDRDHQPLYVKDKLADGREFVLVLDATGCCLMVEGDEVNHHGGRVLPLPFPTQSTAMTFARGIIASTVDEITTLGFIEQ